MNRKYALLTLPAALTAVAATMLAGKASEMNRHGEQNSPEARTKITAAVPEGRGDAASAAAEGDDQVARRLAPLVAAGIDPKSTEAVVKALNHENRGVQFAAVFLVGRRKETTAIPALKILLHDKSSLFRMNVAEALCLIGDASWKPEAVQLLNDPDPLVSMRAAELLAKNGDGRGWDLVKGNLTVPATAYFTEAARMALPFNDVEVIDEGKKVKLNLIDTFVPLFAESSEIIQATIIGVIGRFADKTDIPKVKKLLATVKTGKTTYNRDTLNSLLKKLESAGPAGVPAKATQ